MKKERKWKGRQIIIFIAGILFLLLLGFTIALHILIPKKLQQQLQQISSALSIRYSSIHTSLFASTITLNDLDIVFTPNPAKKEFSQHLHFSKARIKEINFLKLATSKNFSVNTIELDQPDITLDSLFAEKTDSIIKQTKLNLPFKKMNIGKLQVHNAKIHLRSNSTKKLIANGDISLDGIKATDSAVQFDHLFFDLSNIDYPLGETKQAVIDHFMIDSEKKKLLIQNLKIKNRNDQIESQIGELSLNDWDIKDLMNRKLIAGELVLRKIATASQSQGLFNSIPDLSLQVNIKKVKANDISISYKNKNDELKCKGDIQLENLRVKNLNKSFTPDSLELGSIHCELSDISYSLAEELHDVHIEKLEMDSKEKTIEIKSLKTIPRYNKFEYGRRRGWQGNWVKASIPGIKIFNADIQSLFHQKLIADEITVSGCNVYVFRDRRLERKKRNEMLPVAYMKHLPIDIRIRSLTIEPSLVEYEEFPRKWIHTGTLKLVNMQMVLSPFINHPQHGDPDHMDLNASASVMGSGTANAYFKLPLNDELYYAKGRFENLSLPALNSTAENLGDFHIRSGLLNFLNFEFTMTPIKANGKIVGEYHDLVIDKIKIDDSDSTKKEKAGFSSFMLHHVIIPKNKDVSMPERKRTGKVDYIRDPTRFVTYYFIKSLLDGIRSSFTFGFVLPK